MQAELAKRKAKGFSAFQFSSFSTSTFDDEAVSAAIPANEAPAASHAAISHASTQVQVRTQLVTLMAKEVHGEAKAALVAAREQAASASAAAAGVAAAAASAAAAVRDPSHAAVLRHGHAADPNRDDDDDTPGSEEGADCGGGGERKLAQQWEASYARLRRLVELSAKRQRTCTEPPGIGECTAAAATSESRTKAMGDVENLAPANLRLDRRVHAHSDDHERGGVLGLTCRCRPCRPTQWL